MQESIDHITYLSAFMDVQVSRKLFEFLSLSRDVHVLNVDLDNDLEEMKSFSVDRAQLCSQNIDTNKLFDYAQAKYSASEFHHSLSLLKYHRHLVPKTKTLETQWGIVQSSAILNDLDFDKELETLINLVETSLLVSPGQRLNQFAWILHLSLFLFKQSDKIEKLVSIFQRPGYIAAVETSCPWLLRYVVVASVITGKNIRAVSEIVGQESLFDPICKVLENLYVHVDFESVGKSLLIAKDIIQEDFFLCELKETILDSLSRLIAKEISKVFSKIAVSKFLEYTCITDFSKINLDAEITQKDIKFADPTSFSLQLQRKIDKLDKK